MTKEQLKQFKIISKESIKFDNEFLKIHTLVTNLRNKYYYLKAVLQDTCNHIDNKKQFAVSSKKRNHICSICEVHISEQQYQELKEEYKHFISVTGVYYKNKKKVKVKTNKTK